MVDDSFDAHVTRLPIIETLTRKAYKVGEIAFPPEWIPKGDYKGVVKELRGKLKKYKIQLVYMPGTSDDILVYLPPFMLSSRFEATPFPIVIVNGNCRSNLNKSSIGYGIYEFGEGGEITGMCGGTKERRLKYIEELKEQFESHESKFTHGVDAIRLMKLLKKLSFSQLEKFERLIDNQGFRFKTALTYGNGILGHNKSLTQWDIADALKQQGTDPVITNTRLAVSYKYNDDRYEGNPHTISILLYSDIHHSDIPHMLTNRDLEFLEELAQLF